MDIIFYIYLFIFGCLFGSFASVVITRMKEKKSGTISGRSECPKCGHTLSPIDLVPLVSFFITGGKCRYCHSKISWIYPLLELSTGIIFTMIGSRISSGIIIIQGDFFEIAKLVFFLAFGFLTLIYIFYDILYLEIPESILGILIGMTLTGLCIQSLFPNYTFFSYLENSGFFSTHEISLLIGGTILTICGLYIIMLKGFSEIIDSIILITIWGIIGIIRFYLGFPLEDSLLGQSLLGALVLFSFLFLQILVSNGKWMGGGDLRIAILMGLIAGWKYSFFSMMIAYLSGSVIGIVLILYTKFFINVKKKKGLIDKVKSFFEINQEKNIGNTQIPFGPFLAIGIFCVLLYSEILNEYIIKYFH